MDAAANDAAAFANGGERGRNQRSDRREDDSGIEWFGRRFANDSGGTIAHVRTKLVPL